MLIAIFLSITFLDLVVQTVLTFPFWRMQAMPMPTNRQPISVLVAARNEAQNLPRLIDSLLNQIDAVTYEILIVLDRCTDRSFEICSQYAGQHSNFKVIQINECPVGWSPKKWAIQKGIEVAQYEILALTDADCFVPKYWLSGISRQFATGKQLVLGLSPYEKRPGLLNLLIRFETWMTAILYTGLANLGLPYMAVGRNLAYSKAFFRQAGGFEGIAHRLSGDDDLLVNKSAQAKSTATMVDLNTQVLSIPKTSWAEWMSQKSRHGSAGKAYKPTSLAILSVIHFLHILFYVSLVSVLCLQDTFLLALPVYFVRSAFLITLLAFSPWKNKFDLLLWYPVLDVIYLCYILILVPVSAFIQPKWKDRNGGSV